MKQTAAGKAVNGRGQRGYSTMKTIATPSHTADKLRTEKQIADDFDLEKIADSGQCFRWERTGPDSYRIPCGRRCLNIARIAEGRYTLDCSEEDYFTLWRPYFDLDTDYSEIRSRVDPGEDPFLFRAAEAQRGLRILRQDPWEVTVSFIISQNRNIPAIRRSVALLCQAAGEALPDGSGGFFYAFPSPRAVLELGEAGLNRCALGYRAKYVRAAAVAAETGKLDLAALAAAAPEEALENLMELYGVGAKVASCIALYGLHHTDAFPVDTWIRRILQNEYPQGYPFAAYSPYNGVFQQYMFAYYRSRQAAFQSFQSQRTAKLPR